MLKGLARIDRRGLLDSSRPNLNSGVNSLWSVLFHCFGGEVVILWELDPVLEFNFRRMFGKLLWLVIQNLSDIIRFW
jgi:hypothetical protein